MHKGSIVENANVSSPSSQTMAVPTDAEKKGVSECVNGNGNENFCPGYPSLFEIKLCYSTPCEVMAVASAYALEGLEIMFLVNKVQIPSL